ncbi:MAG: right-handed parallel beta-helix repeat-containing protein [Pirellulales bacterium]|nr:right-handed parallel beta-helix repeat-containing protein [Pirellulales bacterium]
MRRFEVLEARYALDGDALLHAGHEAIPNYVLEPDTVSVQDGNWFDPATWSDGVPDAFDDVRIDHHVSISRPPQRGDLTGDGAVDQHDFQTWLDGFRASSPDQGDVDRDGKVDFSDLQIIIDEWFGWSTPVRAEAEDVHVEGTLSFDPNVNTSLQVQTLTVAGSLEIGSQQQPVVAAAEVVFRDAPIDTDFDPQQLGHGLLVIGSGALTVYGRNNTPFVEVAEARAGSRTLVLEQEPSNWLPGDELFLPDSRLLERPAFSQAETVAIEHVDGRVVTLRAPLAFNHDGDGTNLPHAAHLSGNITFRSANPSGVRGHIMVSDRARIDVHDAVFRDLGRTTFDQLDNTHLGPDREVLYVGKNQVGRYSFHIHHLYGPEQADGPQFTFSDNVIRDGKKWGLAVHDSHYGLIENNVVVNMQGSGIVFEDGSE